MSEIDDWAADDGGLDYEEIQEDLSFGADLLGVYQRGKMREALEASRANSTEANRQLAELNRLLRQEEERRTAEQKRERAEKKQLAKAPKCPECFGIVPVGAKRCRHCGSQIGWLGKQCVPLDDPETLQRLCLQRIEKFEEKLPAFSRKVKDFKTTVRSLRRQLDEAFDPERGKDAVLRAIRDVGARYREAADDLQAARAKVLPYAKLVLKTSAPESVEVDPDTRARLDRGQRRAEQVESCQAPASLTEIAGIVLVDRGKRVVAAPLSKCETLIESRKIRPDDRISADGGVWLKPDDFVGWLRQKRRSS